MNRILSAAVLPVVLSLDTSTRTNADIRSGPRTRSPQYSRDLYFRTHCRYRRRSQESQYLVCGDGIRRTVEDQQSRRDVPADFRQRCVLFDGLRHCRSKNSDVVGWERARTRRSAPSAGATASTKAPTLARPGRTWACAHSEHIAKILIDPRDSNRGLRGLAGAAVFAPAATAACIRLPMAARPGQPILQISENTGVTDIDIDPRNPDVMLRRGLPAPAQYQHDRGRRSGRGHFQDHRRRQELEEAHRRICPPWTWAASRWPFRRRSPTWSMRSS